MDLKKIGNNLVVLTTNHGHEVLYSYETAVAGKFPNGKYFKSSKKYSSATTRHINKYLNGAEAIDLTPEGIEAIFN